MCNAACSSVAESLARHRPDALRDFLSLVAEKGLALPKDFVGKLPKLNDRFTADDMLTQLLDGDFPLVRLEFKDVVSLMQTLAQRKQYAAVWQCYDHVKQVRVALDGLG